MCSDTANIVPRELLKGAYVLRHCKYWGQKSPPSVPSVVLRTVPTVPTVIFLVSFSRVGVSPTNTKKQQFAALKK